MIKTKEVIKELKKMNFKTQILESSLLVFDRAGETIARVDLKEKFEIDTYFWNFRGSLTEDEREKVYVLLTKLAETDPEDREEEKKYYLKHKWLLPEEYRYLCKDDNYYFLAEKLQSSENCIPFYELAKFTKEQIEEFKRTFNTNLEDFELIEVEE